MAPAAAAPLSTDSVAEVASAEKTEAETADTDPILIIGERDGYDIKGLLSGTRTEEDPRDVPQTINAVTAKQIADQAIRSIGELTRYVPGISAESGEGHRDAIAIRGQLSTADFYTDGLRDDVQHYRGLYNVERVEVLKGPNALLFGRGGGGGLVNRVLKRPFATPYQAVSLGADSEGAGNVDVDFNTPLADGVYGRLNATLERFDNFRDVEGRRYAINPTLGIELGSATRIDLGFEHADDERDVDRGVPSVGVGTIDNPASPLDGYDTTFFGRRDTNRATFDKQVADLQLRHEFAPDVRLRSKLLYGDYDKLYANATPSSAVTDVNGVPSVVISAYQDRTARTNLLFTNDVAATFRTGALENLLMVGVDGAFQDTSAGRLQGFFDTLPASEKSANGRQITVPLAEDLAIAPVTFRGGSGERASETHVEAIGLFVQNQASIGPVRLIAGVRHDWVDVEVRDLLAGTELSRRDALWSPRVGAVLEVSDTTNLYASWSRSFVPQSGDQFSSLSPTTAALEPERFTNIEVGAKGSIRGLDWSIAAFRLDATNQTAVDPLTNDTVLTGAQRSEGIEAAVQGRIGKLSLAGGVIVQNGEIVEDTASAPAGRQVGDIPDFEASLWGRYDFSDRLGLGLGVTHRSEVFTSFSNAVVIDPLTRVDGALYANLTDRIGLQVNAENLLNGGGIEFAHGDNNLTPVQPRKVRASLNFLF